jgi:hypothetical protein
MAGRAHGGRRDVGITGQGNAFPTLSELADKAKPLGVLLQESFVEGGGTVQGQQTFAAFSQEALLQEAVQACLELLAAAAELPQALRSDVHGDRLCGLVNQGEKVVRPSFTTTIPLEFL